MNPLNGQVTWNLSAGQAGRIARHEDRRPPAIGDIDGDGWLEIVQGTNEEYVRGESATSTSLRSRISSAFPLSTAGCTRSPTTAT